MTAQDVVERIMTLHWDMAACTCWVCEAGRELGFRPRDAWWPPDRSIDLNTGERRVQ